MFVPGRDDHGEEDGDARVGTDRPVLEATANAAGIPGAAETLRDLYDLGGLDREP